MTKRIGNLRKSGHRKIRIAILLILVLGVGALLFYLKNQKGNETVDNTAYEAIERRTIVSSVSGTGTVVSANSESISAGLFGTEVTSINVAEGDVVEAGTLIATLDTSALQQQKELLQNQITNLRNSQVDYHNTYNEGQTNSEAARQEQITNITARLESAKSDLEVAKTDLSETQAEYDAMLQDETAEQRDLYSLQLVLETKKTNVSTLQTRVDTLQDSLDALNAGSFTDAGAALTEYDATVDSSVSSLQGQINDIQKQIDKGNVTCSMAGTVTSVNVSVGDTYTGNTIATIEGVDTLLVEAYIDEYDIADVTAGMTALMKTDSTRDTELQGTVTYVAPKASSGNDAASSYSSLLSGMGLGDIPGTTNSSASYLVRISIDTGNDRLRLGMTSKVSIILSQSENVLSVPIEAVQKDNEGNTYVEVKDEEETSKSEDGSVVNKKVYVTTGIEGVYYIEINGDVEEGMEVVVPSSSGEESVDDLINMMGAAGGV
ncbi:MAG: HlyD family efflux transporter periplasmic adaptor subunit [Lachnospiraceae bacterium]|nr:HlyD family efflux transporter periplasmic adaptor subunit [Lachnospiraceae bacterium]